MRDILNPMLLMLLVLTGCSDREGSAEQAEIAVTNSYLQCVVRDLSGPEMRVLCLAPPGMCPGHFDIGPASVKTLRGCRALLLFDFQHKVEATLARLKRDGLKTFQVTDASGLCLPATYLAACRQVATFLSQEYPGRAAEFAARLAAIEQRLEQLHVELRDTVAKAGVQSTPALVSNHQAAFVEWLGLETVATFVGSDTETVARIDHCLRQAAGQGVRCVIANQQEGTGLAKALAQRLGAEAVVFSNFPVPIDDGRGFDALLRENVKHLLEAVVR